MHERPLLIPLKIYETAVPSRSFTPETHIDSARLYTLLKRKVVIRFATTVNFFFLFFPFLLPLCIRDKAVVAIPPLSKFFFSFYPRLKLKCSRAPRDANGLTTGSFAIGSVYPFLARFTSIINVMILVGEPRRLSKNRFQEKKKSEGRNDCPYPRVGL